MYDFSDMSDAELYQAYAYALDARDTYSAQAIRAEQGMRRANRVIQRDYARRIGQAKRMAAAVAKYDARMAALRRR